MSDTHETRELNDDELRFIASAVEDICGQPCSVDQARRLAEELDLQVEVNHYGPELGYSASRWITAWSKDQ